MYALQTAQIRYFCQIHQPINRRRYHHSLDPQTRAKISTESGDLPFNHHPFDEIPPSDTFAWNTLIRTHLSNGDLDHVMSIYGKMLLRGIRPDKHTLPRILTASRLSGRLFYGKQVHGQALKLGLSSDQYVITALMAFYGRLNGAEAAKWLFDRASRKNSVSWTLLAGLYIMEDKPQMAIDVFNRMMEVGADIDPVALATVLEACGHLRSIQEGRKVHDIARKCGLVSDVLVSNSLIKMYVECGKLEDARSVFEQMSSKDAISWTAIVGGYVKNGGFNEGLKLFRLMNLEGVRPDAHSVSSVLPACARMSAFKNGKEIHGYILKSNINSSLTAQNAVTDMYMKSGGMEYASKVFAMMREKDTVSWTIMILGCSLHGQGDLALQLFRQMQKSTSLQPDQAMYLAVLHACCTSRNVGDGKFYFNCITSPKAEHYALMVSVLGRAGLLDEARAFIADHQIGRHAEVQRALLDGCRIHRNQKLGKQAIQKLCDLEPLNADNYIALSNFYASCDKWDMVDKMREIVRDMGLRANRAYSWIEVKRKVHVFGVGDVSHPRAERIYWELQVLMKKMKEEEAYVPDADFSLHDVDEERECVPIGHSEMLAIAFGLISTPATTTIRVTKNLRVCRSCHNFAKVLSKMVEREIVLKDPNCFHRFKNGVCSCQDFW